MTTAEGDTAAAFGRAGFIRDEADVEAEELADTAGAELSVEVVSAEFAASAGVNEAAMAIAKRVFLLIFTILLREKTNIGVTIENALLQHLGFSLGVLPKG